MTNYQNSIIEFTTNVIQDRNLSSSIHKIFGGRYFNITDTLLSRRELLTRGITEKNSIMVNYCHLFSNIHFLVENLLPYMEYSLESIREASQNTYKRLAKNGDYWWLEMLGITETHKPKQSIIFTDNPQPQQPAFLVEVVMKLVWLSMDLGFPIKPETVSFLSNAVRINLSRLPNASTTSLKDIMLHILCGAFDDVDITKRAELVSLSGYNNLYTLKKMGCLPKSVLYTDLMPYKQLISFQGEIDAHRDLSTTYSVPAYTSSDANNTPGYSMYTPIFDEIMEVIYHAKHSTKPFIYWEDYTNNIIRFIPNVEINKLKHITEIDFVLATPNRAKHNEVFRNHNKSVKFCPAISIGVASKYWEAGNIANPINSSGMPHVASSGKEVCFGEHSRAAYELKKQRGVLASFLRYTKIITETNSADIKDVWGKFFFNLYSADKVNIDEIYVAYNNDGIDKRAVAFFTRTSLLHNTVDNEVALKDLTNKKYGLNSSTCFPEKYPLVLRENCAILNRTQVRSCLAYMATYKFTKKEISNSVVKQDILVNSPHKSLTHTIVCHYIPLKVYVAYIVSLVDGKDRTYPKRDLPDINAYTHTIMNNSKQAWLKSRDIQSLSPYRGYTRPTRDNPLSLI